MPQYSNDPRWIQAKFPGVAKNGQAFKKGDRIFYYPLTKTILVGKDAETASAEFAAAAADEKFMNGY